LVRHESEGGEEDRAVVVRSDVAVSFLRKTTARRGTGLWRAGLVRAREEGGGRGGGRGKWAGDGPGLVAGSAEEEKLACCLKKNSKPLFK
jgi:hypothetical protein